MFIPTDVDIDQVKVTTHPKINTYIVLNKSSITITCKLIKSQTPMMFITILFIQTWQENYYKHE